MSGTETILRPATHDARRLTAARLLAAGAAAGPLFALVAWVQVWVVNDFDITRHALSQLSLGRDGWIQTTNFIVTGLLFLAGSVGLHRVSAGGRRRTWGPRLLGGFAVTLIVAGLFPTDPANGFPSGAREPETPTWHGIVHATAPALGIFLAALACLIFARRYARERRRAMCAASVAAAVVMFAPDGYPGAGQPGYTFALAFTACLGFIWCSVVVADHTRRAATPSNGS